LVMPFLEGIGDVFQENQSQDYMFVLGGIHVATELIRRLPHLFFKA